MRKRQILFKIVFLSFLSVGWSTIINASEILNEFKETSKAQLDDMIKNRNIECLVVSEDFLIGLLPPYDNYDKTPFGPTFEHKSEDDFKFLSLCFIQAGFLGYSNFFKHFLEYRWLFDLGAGSDLLWSSVFEIAQHYNHQDILELFVHQKDAE